MIFTGKGPLRSDYTHCSKCGVREHIHLLDAKPEPGFPETADFTVLECVRCYGPGYALLALEHIKLSVAPALRPLYSQYCLMGLDV